MRDRLELTAPEALESREQFLRRLSRTVKWMNRTWRAQALCLARNQKERAKAVLRLQGGAH